jgi:hypothetical protein
MPDATRLRRRVKVLQEGTRDEKELVAVVSPGNVIRVEERGKDSRPVCTCDYSRCVIGPTGVAWLREPSGKVREVKPCTCHVKGANV